MVGIDCAHGRIAGVTVEHERRARDGHAPTTTWRRMPVEQLRRLVSPRAASRPSRAWRGRDRLRTRWMNGIMFYLRQDVPILAGHTIYIDSDWALTSVSQRQFWPRTDFARLGDGHVGGILSVDVSDWERPSRRTGKVASKCSADEIKAEVWAQLKDHLNDTGARGARRREPRERRFLDEDITFPNPSAAANAEPLLINTAGSWADRPEAVTRVPNLFLASDFVRTYTDLATMEGANEAARRAVNGILDATRVDARRCDVWKLAEPAIFGPARAARPGALEARPPAGQAAAAGRPQTAGSSRSGWPGA